MPARTGCATREESRYLWLSKLTALLQPRHLFVTKCCQGTHSWFASLFPLGLVMRGRILVNQSTPLHVEKLLSSSAFFKATAAFAQSDTLLPWLFVERQSVNFGVLSPTEAVGAASVASALCGLLF